METEKLNRLETSATLRLRAKHSYLHSSAKNCTKSTKIHKIYFRPHSFLSILMQSSLTQFVMLYLQFSCCGKFWLREFEQMWSKINLFLIIEY